MPHGGPRNVLTYFSEEKSLTCKEPGPTPDYPDKASVHVLTASNKSPVWERVNTLSALAHDSIVVKVIGAAPVAQRTLR